MTMDFFLDRKLQTILQDRLASVPGLVEELTITITRQSRIQRNGLGKPRRQKPGSRLPYHIAAAAAADELQNALSTWVRHVCEERQIAYTGHSDAITLSRWLRKHMISLALTQGSEEAYDDLVDRIDECRKQIDLPPDDEVIIDRARVQEANRQVLTAGQVEKIAPRLGDMGKKLTTERVHTLNRRGHLRPITVDPDTGTKFYRLGDVLHAHMSCEKRNRKKPA